MRNFEEFLLLRNMLGGDGWLSAIMLASLIGVCVFRPERITSRVCFRWAYLLFGFSVVAPTLNYLLPMLSSVTNYGQSRNTELQLLLVIIAVAQPALLGFSIMAFIAALSPFRKPKQPPAPQPHPLD